MSTLDLTALAVELLTAYERGEMIATPPSARDAGFDLGAAYAVEEGSGRNSLRSPALCLAELGAAIARQPGAGPLVAGEVISSGTLTTPQPVAAGENWKAQVEGLDLPNLTLTLFAS